MPLYAIRDADTPLFDGAFTAVTRHIATLCRHVLRFPYYRYIRRYCRPLFAFDDDAATSARLFACLYAAADIDDAAAIYNVAALLRPPLPFR